MGAQATIFSAQRAAFPELVVPPWLPPSPRESLARYAERMARAIDPGRPCIVGGTSFGGFVAVEMRRHLDCRGCILIASVRGPSGLPLRARAYRVFAPLLDPSAFRLVTAGGPFVSRLLRPLLRPAQVRLLRELGAADAGFLRWAAAATLRWREEVGEGHGPDAGAHRESRESPPIRHIHGTRDWILPHRRVDADELIAGGGHLIVVTHAERVNAFIRRAVAEWT